MDLTLEYLNKTMGQLLLVTSLLGGFALSISVSLLARELRDRIWRALFVVSLVAAASFVVALVAQMKVVFMSTTGYPIPTEVRDTGFHYLLGMGGFGIGVMALCALIGLFGWTKSRKLGLFTSALGLLTLVLLVVAMIDFR